MRLAARRPELVKTLTLMNTGAHREPAFNRLRYGFLAQLVKIVGTAPFTGIAVKELFGKSTRSSTDRARRKMLEEWTGKLRTRPANTAQALMGVMNRPEFTLAELAEIRCPTLIITGEDDTAQPPHRSETLAAIPGSSLVRIPSCGHSSSLEAAHEVINAMQGLLEGQKGVSPLPGSARL